MKSFALSLLGLLCSSSLLLSISDTCAAAAKVSKGGTRNLKAGKKGKKGKKNGGDPTSACCTRDVYSVVDPNASWTDHTFHTQVWYHTLDDIYKLWKEDYFDYVLDIRPLQDNLLDSGLLLEGWETIHIPGSFPINVFPPDTPANEVEMLVDFASSKVCKDARIFVHCWSGNAGNMVAKTLIELGFTNVHAAGPQGSAGMWQWRDAGYELVMGDTFNAEEKRFQPACIDMCNAS
jgi:rhodanese-related sulfurtransferase